VQLSDILWEQASTNISKETDEQITRRRIVSLREAIAIILDVEIEDDEDE